MGTFPRGNVPASIVRVTMLSSRGSKTAADKAPTILDVARLAGLSKSVVSRAMRGEASVSESSRSAVRAAAEALGYRANAVARSLVQRRTYNVGVMVSDLHNIFFAEVLDGLYAAAAQLGYRALLTTGNREPAAERRAIEQLLELRADGLIIAAPRVGSATLRAAATVVPTAVIGGVLRMRNVDVVVDDDVAGAAMAVDHLAGLGHELIAHIDGGKGAGSAERRLGYERAMARRGLRERIVVQPGDFTEIGGYEGARRLLARRHRPTAIFASNDLAAVGALDAINEAGLEVPRHVSLMGYDNTALAALRHISLTTIHQPRDQIGDIAMRAVIRRIEQPGAPARRHVLAPTLVVRDTTAKPQA